MVIEISCLNLNCPNFWTGEWQSTWTIKDGAMQGHLKINAHYFEKGNS